MFAHATRTRRQAPRLPAVAAALTLVALLFPDGDLGIAAGRTQPDPRGIQDTGHIFVGVDRKSQPQVKAFNQDGDLRASFFAYDPAFMGGVRVAVGDVNGDGRADLITGSGPGGPPTVRTWDITTQGPVQLMSFLAGPQNFKGGVFVAAGDVNGDGNADIIVGAGAGQGAGSHVKVFSGNNGVLLNSFFAFGRGFTGGRHRRLWRLQWR